MNDFNPKEIKKASQYLQERLESIKDTSKPVYKVEEEKTSRLKQFVSAIFKR